MKPERKQKREKRGEKQEAQAPKHTAKGNITANIRITFSAVKYFISFAPLYY
jgi:hypothetical protein